MIILLPLLSIRVAATIPSVPTTGCVTEAGRATIGRRAAAGHAAHAAAGHSAHAAAGHSAHAAAGHSAHAAAGRAAHPAAMHAADEHEGGLGNDGIGGRG